MRKPDAKGATASIIKESTAIQETATERLVKKYLPAWVVSSGIHVVLAVVALVVSRYFWNNDNKMLPVETEVQAAEKEDDNKPLPTEVIPGIDEQLPALPDIAVEKPLNSDSPVQDNNPLAGSDKTDLMIPLDQLNTPEFRAPKIDSNMNGPGGLVGEGKNMPFLNRGSSGTRNKLAYDKGGTPESQLAVAKGLAWLARQQLQDGSWKYDNHNDKIAATGHALLPFLAAGQTHKKNVKEPKESVYFERVLSGIQYLIKQQQPDGSFKGSSGMYGHAIATVALCECLGMTGDKYLLQKPAQAAINYIQTAQAPNGSWGYTPKTDGDTSIVGWQIQALQSGKLCKDIVVDKVVMTKARDFLDSVSTGSLKATYGYRTPGEMPTLTAVGLLCRYYMDGWGSQHPGYREGVSFLMKQWSPGGNRNEFNMYYYYYATQVMHFHEGDQWYKEWNPKMRDMLIKMQIDKKENQAIDGSWDADQGISGGAWGRLGSTCMCLLTLEVYYRHTPLHKRDTGGLSELERGK